MLQQFLHRKTFQWLTAVLLFGLLSGLWWFAVADERHIRDDSSKRLDDEALTIRRMELEMSQTAGALNRYRQNQEEVAYFEKTFLQNKKARLLAISKFLDERTRARGINKDRIGYHLIPAREHGLEIYAIDMPLAGRYREIRGLIGDIESSDLFLIITELTLENDDAGSGTVEVQLSLATYFEGERP